MLGFEDLREYLQARCDAGSSVPGIAAELGVRDWQVQAALARLAVRLAPRPQRLAARRRRHTEERIAACVAALGFADVQAYLLDRVVERGWLLAEVAAELAAHRVTVRRLLDCYGIRRVRRTPAERAAAESGRRVQTVGWQARRAARLAELGFGRSGGELCQLLPELKGLIPGLEPPPVVDLAAARFRLYQAVTGLLRRQADARPLLVVVDDLHWADTGSLRLLVFLAGELRAARLVVLGTYRDVEMATGQPLAETLGTLAREPLVERIALGGLGQGRGRPSGRHHHRAPAR